jgi:spore coat polysaccharide biosynthesis protein SpsF
VKIAAIVQARMGSSRLPGKVLLPLADDHALGLVIRRLQSVARLDDVVVATSTSVSDDVIADAARARNVRVVRGSEHDVLARYAAAVAQTRADIIVRITADCPLLDPTLVAEMILGYGACQSPVDYYSNTIERTYPRGLDVEIVPGATLLLADREARADFEREHVMPFIWQRPERFRIVQHHEHGGCDRSAMRWTLDTQEDYTFLRTVFERLGDAGSHDRESVMALLAREPAIAALNAHVAQKIVPH